MEEKLEGNLPLWYRFEIGASLYSDPVYNTNFTVNNVPFVTYGVTNPETVFAGAEQGFKEVYWTLTSGTRYPTNCNCSAPGAIVDPGLAQGSETIMLVAPGSRLTPRLTQLDVAIRRAFLFHEHWTIKLEGQIFNILNANTVYNEAQTLGTSVTPFVSGGLGGTPTAIVNPRMLRLAVQFKF